MLTHATSRSLWGARGYNLPSRFLDELGAGTERERLRPASWSQYGRRETRVEPDARGSVALDGRLGAPRRRSARGS